LKKIVITGGAGFIGSHIVEHFADAYPDAEIVVLDKMTYAADVRNLLHLMTNGRVQLVVGDVCDLDLCVRTVKGADLVIHAAAESHVDNSFGNSFEFTRTNVVGVHSVLEACLREDVEKIIHVSTDEVYGEVMSGAADEQTALRPTKPYSASKAAAEMIVSGYLRSFKIPVVTVRANNIFGIRQFPEKILPKFLIRLMTGQSLTLHGSGKNIRHYLSAHDLARALELLVNKGRAGECYNIGTDEEYTNAEIAGMICDLFGVDTDHCITFVEDRPFNDFRYALDTSRMEVLGWVRQHSLKKELPSMARWYADNAERYVDAGKIIRKPLVSAA
jgi:dTDP-glucose 4,6-dehydratase